MIICNLAVLLAERQTKITRVASDTGISRTTLTALSKNSSKGVQLDTVNALCQYLKIEPKDFFEYLPFDVTCDVTVTENDTWASDNTLMDIPVNAGNLAIDVYIKVKSYNSKTLTFGYSGENKNKTHWGTTLEFDLKKDDSDDFKKIWDNEITPSFKPLIWSEIKKSIVDAINSSMVIRFTGENENTIKVIDKGDLELTTDFDTDVLDLGDLPF